MPVATKMQARPRDDFSLRANHLRILSDGLIHSSQAVLWASRVAEWSAEDRAAYARLAAKLGVAGVPF